jgi:hypothetical protein
MSKSPKSSTDQWGPGDVRWTQDVPATEATPPRKGALDEEALEAAFEAAGYTKHPQADDAVRVLKIVSAYLGAIEGKRNEQALERASLPQSDAREGEKDNSSGG